MNGAIPPLPLRTFTSAGTATGYKHDGPEIEYRCSEISCIRPDWPWSPLSPLDCGYRVSLPGTERPWRGFDHPPTSSVEVKERVELYSYSPSVPSRPVLGRTLPYMPSWHGKRQLYLFHGLICGCGRCQLHGQWRWRNAQRRLKLDLNVRQLWAPNEANSLISFSFSLSLSSSYTHTHIHTHTHTCSQHWLYIAHRTSGCLWIFLMKILYVILVSSMHSLSAARVRLVKSGSFKTKSFSDDQESPSTPTQPQIFLPQPTSFS